MGKLEETEWLPSTVEDTRDLRDPKTVAKDLHTEEGDEDKE
jgi:hypothetical protein